jgi:hypothetical protein
MMTTDQLHAPTALNQGKNPGTYWRLPRPQSRSTRPGEENLLSLQRFEPHILQIVPWSLNHATQTPYVTQC